MSMDRRRESRGWRATLTPDEDVTIARMIGQRGERDARSIRGHLKDRSAHVLLPPEDAEPRRFMVSPERGLSRSCFGPKHPASLKDNVGSGARPARSGRANRVPEPQESP